MILDDFAHPTEYISSATLEALGGANAGWLMDETHRVVETDSEAWFATLDPTTAVVLTTAGDGATDVVEVPVTPGRTTERHVARVSVRAGYWFGRMLLQTGHAPLHWSSDPKASAARIEATVGAIDVVYLWDYVEGVDLSDDFTTWICDRVGLPGNEDVINVAALTFDTGLAIAVVEHDLASAEEGSYPELSSP